MQMPSFINNFNYYKPKVSIIVTVYNHANYVADAIKSVLTQSFQDYELIIINDGSTDNTREVIERYRDSERVTIKNIQHVGRQKALNMAFKLAKGDYITVLDSDDMYLKDKISKQVEYLDNHPEIVMVGTNAIEVDLIHQKKYLNKPPITDGEIRYLLLYEALFPFPVIMVRRRILKSVGYCDESLQLKEDFDLFAKIATKGKIASISEVLVIIRRHANNNFKYFDPETHRQSMLKVRWSNLWRLKPDFLMFNRMMLWLSFEFLINLFPKTLRRKIPFILRGFVKGTKMATPPRSLIDIKNMSRF